MEYKSDKPSQLPHAITLSRIRAKYRYYAQDDKIVEKAKGQKDSSKPEEDKSTGELQEEPAAPEKEAKLGKAIGVCLLGALNSVCPLQRVMERRGVGIGDLQIFKHNMNESINLIRNLTDTTPTDTQIDDGIEKLQAEMKALNSADPSPFSGLQFKPTVNFVRFASHFTGSRSQHRHHDFGLRLQDNQV